MKYFRLCVIAMLFICFTGCTNHIKSEADSTKLSDDVEVSRLTESIWLHTTYYEFPNGKCYPANGIIVLSGDDSMMIDTPWTDKQAAILFDWIEKYHKTTVKTVVPTHSHIDCAGGLREAHQRGADSWAFIETINKLKNEKKTAPKHGFDKIQRLECGDISIELAYLGAGHTTDNIVAWIPSHKLLFGGCLVKSFDANNLGNIKEADLDNYPKTLEAILQKYPDAKVIVPGHGKPGDLQLIKHTIELCSNKN